jgi:hypothetical protein
MTEHLGDILRRMRKESLIREAETIRDYPSGGERDEEAWKYIREAMVQRAIGRIGREQEYQVFTILAFAMPSDAPGLHETSPIDAREEPAGDAEEETEMPADVACYLGCEACDGGGRMTDADKQQKPPAGGFGVV